MPETSRNLPNQPTLHTAQRQLRAWYAQNGRKTLPWRNTADPYAIWLSEVMLQQTQVSTVLERYYFPFLERFPSVQSLAHAPRDAVLKAWEGLGYYTRAVNLHKAAAQATPALPETVEALMALPGIGRNTAHAVAAFAFHQPVPVMEANVKRILHRLMGWEQASDKQLWQAADDWLDREDPFTYNQAMMDVGALVCRPKAPDCTACPLATACLGKTEPERYPAKRQKKAVQTRKRILLIGRDANGAIFLEQTTGRLLQGLYRFPQYETGPQSLDGQPVGKTRQLGNLVHVYSHFRLEAEVQLAEFPARNDTRQWFSREAIAGLPLSGVDRKALALL